MAAAPRPVRRATHRRAGDGETQPGDGCDIAEIVLHKTRAVRGEVAISVAITAAISGRKAYFGCTFGSPPVERVTLTRKHIQLQLRQIGDAAVQTDADEDASRPVSDQLHGTVNVTIPWTSTVQAAAKAIIHVPAHNTPITPSRRDALLMAIAKARYWIDDLAHGRAASFAVIARREGKVERHIRLLVPLAFVSPRIVSALLEGTAPAGLTITALARALPWSWAEQERRLGLH
jgi:hypothetical protein